VKGVKCFSKTSFAQFLISMGRFKKNYSHPSLLFTKRKRVMIILYLLQADGIAPKKVSLTHGGEFASPCPVCGGKDRFRCWPGQGEGGKWWCRQCNRGGDLIQYLRDVRGLSYIDACKALGKEPLMRNPLLSWTGRNNTSVWRPAEPGEVRPLWQEKAAAFSDHAEKMLRSTAGASVLEWLRKKRGLTDATIRAFRLGWNPRDMWRERKAWGLSEETKENGRPKKLWLPAGVLIPCFTDGKISRLRIRRQDLDKGEQDIDPDEKKGPRYYVIPGSTATSMVFGSNTRNLLVIESELDAMLLLQEAGSLAGILSLGNAQTRPDEAAARLLQEADLIFLSLDADDAGAKESWRWWADHFERARRWPPVGGKDPGEMFGSGIDIKAWIRAGLEAYGMGEASPAAPQSSDPAAAPELPAEALPESLPVEPATELHSKFRAQTDGWYALLISGKTDRDITNLDQALFLFAAETLKKSPDLAATWDLFRTRWEKHLPRPAWIVLESHREILQRREGQVPEQITMDRPARRP